MNYKNSNVSRLISLKNNPSQIIINITLSVKMLLKFAQIITNSLINLKIVHALLYI